MIVLVRHGRTRANAAGLLLGRADVALDETGERQAAAAATAIGPVDRVVSSPLQRARQTASRFGVEVEVDPRWVELDYGDWDEQPAAAVGAEQWQRWRSDVDFAPPGGESLSALAARVREACDELALRAIDETIVVVTHVSPLKIAVAWALGVSDEISWRCFVSPGSISRIDVGAHGPTLVSFNESAL